MLVDSWEIIFTLELCIWLIQHWDVVSANGYIFKAFRVRKNKTQVHHSCWFHVSGFKDCRMRCYSKSSNIALNIVLVTIFLLLKHAEYLWEYITTMIFGVCSVWNWVLGCQLTDFRSMFNQHSPCERWEGSRSLFYVRYHQDSQIWVTQMAATHWVIHVRTDRSRFCKFFQTASGSQISLLQICPDRWKLTIFLHN